MSKIQKEFTTQDDPLLEAQRKLHQELDKKYWDEKSCAEYFEPLTDEELVMRRELIQREGDDLRRKESRERMRIRPMWRRYKKAYDDYVYGKSDKLPNIPE